MAQISDFSTEEAELIVSLPYRVGVYVSYADDEDGERDDEREMQAMEACIKEISRLHEGSEFIKEVALKILSSKGEWSSWSQNVFNLEPLCEKAVLILKSQCDDTDIKNYIKMILEIASAVAQAYGEFGEEVEPEKGFFGKAVSRIAQGFAGMSGDDAAHPMNVSAAEDSAISSIATALKKNLN